MVPKRKAHYLSRFFLAGFTSEGRGSGFLHVRSKKQQRNWKARAAEVAHQRDLFVPVGPVGETCLITCRKVLIRVVCGVPMHA
jgi:hypothetical protein